MNDKIGEFSRLLEEIFLARLSAKTGWGKNEIALLFQRAQVEAMREMIDKE